MTQTTLHALDLFCGGGGVTAGLKRAGFHVTGVDIKAQPNYCGDVFIQGDALNPPVDLSQFDFIWASPPCQAHTSLKTMKNANKNHKDLIPQTRELLISSGKKWVIENVVGAPLKNFIVLCGSMFGLETEDGTGQLRRHRLFEANFSFPLVPKCNHRGRAVTVVSKGGGYNKKKGRAPFYKNDKQKAMGIDWMSDYEMSQAIPPAYAEFIGQQAIKEIGGNTDAA